MLKYVPNTLTIIRFILIPGIIALAISGNYLGAIIVITISGLTDVLDGTIARKYNLISDFGKLMDPLADKATQLATLATLVFKQIVPLWIFLIMIIKEFVMIAGASFLYGKDLVVSSKWYGKLTTVCLYLAIVISLMIRQFQGNINNINGKLRTILLNLDKPLFYIAVVTTLFSLIMYIRAFYIKGYLKENKETK